MQVVSSTISATPCGTMPETFPLRLLRQPIDFACLQKDHCFLTRPLTGYCIALLGDDEKKQQTRSCRGGIWTEYPALAVGICFNKRIDDYNRPTMMRMDRPKMIRNHSLQLVMLRPTLGLRIGTFTTSSTVKAKPVRPEKTGQVIAHFPQKNETQHLKEDPLEFQKRYKRYIDDLGRRAAPERLAGRDFGSRVRTRPRSRREKERCTDERKNGEMGNQESSERSKR
jgi:hypothetical protein